MVLAGSGCEDKETAAAVDRAKSIVAKAPPPPGAHVIVVIDSSGSQSSAHTTAASVFIERLPAGTHLLVLDCNQACRPIGPSKFLTRSRWRSLAGEQLQNIEGQGPTYPFEWIRVASHLTRLADPALKELPAVAVAFTDGIATAGETRPGPFADAARPLLEDAGLGLVIADGDSDGDDVFETLGESERVARVATEQTAGPEPLVDAVERIGKVVGGERPEPVIALDAGDSDAQQEQRAKHATNDQSDEQDSNRPGKTSEASTGDEEEPPGEASPSSNSGRGIGLMQVRQRAVKDVALMEPTDSESPFAGEVDPFEVAEAAGKDADSDGMSPLERIRQLVVHRQYDDARTRLRERLEAHPDDTQAWLYLARLTAFTSTVGEGVDVLEKMVETLPAEPSASIALAAAYTYEKQWPIRCAHLHRVNNSKDAHCRPKTSADCPLASHLTIWGVEAKQAGLTAEQAPTDRWNSPGKLGDHNNSSDMVARLELESERRALPIVVDDQGFIHLWKSPSRFETRVEPGVVEVRVRHLMERAYRMRVVPFEAQGSAEPTPSSLKIRLAGEPENYEFDLGDAPVDVVDFTFEMPDYDDIGGDAKPDAFSDWRADTCAARQ